MSDRNRVQLDCLSGQPVGGWAQVRRPQLVRLAGLGFTTAPAIEAIMGSLSADKAAVGAAVNDTTRELGGIVKLSEVGAVANHISLMRHI